MKPTNARIKSTFPTPVSYTAVCRWQALKTKLRTPGEIAGLCINLHLRILKVNVLADLEKQGGAQRQRRTVMGQAGMARRATAGMAGRAMLVPVSGRATGRSSPVAVLQLD